MNRRHVLKLLGGGVGVAGLGAGARFALLPPSPSGSVKRVDQLAVEIFDSLHGDAKRQACVPYDHPLRQYHNRGVWGGGLRISPLTLGWDQRALLTDLLYAGLSQAGRARVPHEFFINYPGVHLMSLLICGDPNHPPYQIVLTGPHLNLRLGGASREGVAFGGPQVYGDQRGDSEPGLPGNLYRYQLELGQRLFDSLPADQQQQAVQRESPIQTMIELGGTLSGMPLVHASRESKSRARQLIDGILSTYADEDVAYAQRCLREHGGVDGLFFSCYRDGEVDGVHQIFRLEGPTAVFYFRGHPHVHAFINVAMDSTPLSVGELLGDNPRVLEKRAVKELFEAAMRDYAGSARAYYDEASVVGRLRSGPIRTGDIYSLESWQNRVVTLRVRGPNDVYDVATIDYVADEQSEKLGKIESRSDLGPMLRDLTISHLKKRGFV